MAALDWPFIEKTNWPQGASLRSSDAVARLREIGLVLSSPLSGRTLEQQPKVVQVWFEPSPRQIVGNSMTLIPGPLIALHGDIKLSPREIFWSASDDIERLQAMLGSTGRVMLRVHCAHLVDEKERSFSSSVDALVGVQSPHLPAGLFEGWFFVVAEGSGSPAGIATTPSEMVVKRAKGAIAAAARKRGSRGP